MITYNKTSDTKKITLTPSQTPVGSVIWLHGLGADGQDFVPIVQELKLPDSLPLRFIFPHAPVRPVTINNGFPMRAWFDIYSMTVHQRVDYEGIEDSIKTIHDLIEHEKSLGIPTENIVLAGFSQGSVIALVTGLNYPELLGGVIVLSGFLPNTEQVIVTANIKDKEIPLFMAHGNQDTVVPYILGKNTAETLLKAGYPVTWREYNIAHTVCEPEVRDIAQWLNRIFYRS